MELFVFLPNPEENVTFSCSVVLWAPNLCDNTKQPSCLCLIFPPPTLVNFPPYAAVCDKLLPGLTFMPFFLLEDREKKREKNLLVRDESALQQEAILSSERSFLPFCSNILGKTQGQAEV